MYHRTFEIEGYWRTGQELVLDFGDFGKASGESRKTGIEVEIRLESTKAVGGNHHVLAAGSLLSERYSGCYQYVIGCHCWCNSSRYPRDHTDMSHLKFTDLKKLHLISPKVVALVRTSPMIHLTHLSILNPLEVDTVYGLLESRPLLPNLVSLTLIVTLIITSSESFRYPRQKSRPLAKGSSSPTSTNATNSILPHIKTLVIGMHGLGGCFAPPPKDFDGQHCCTAFDTLTGLMDILKHCTTLLHLTFISPASNPTITDITSNFLALPPSLLSYTHVPNGTFTTGVKASDPFWRDNAGKQLERFLRKDPSSCLKLKVLRFHESWREMIEEVLGKEKVGSVQLVGNLEETDGLIEYYIRLANF